MTATLLYDMATSLLESAEDSIEDGGYEVPDRRYVSIGDPAWDCRQLTVNIGTVRPADAAGRRPPCSVRLESELCVVWLTCVSAEPGGDGMLPPSAEDLDVDGLYVASVGWQLYRGLLWRWANGALLADYSSGCEAVSFGPLEWLGPDGGIAGARVCLTLRPLVDSYEVGS